MLQPSARIAILLAATAALIPSQSVTASPSDAIDVVLEGLFAIDLAPGMAVVAVKGDRVVYQRAFGFADREAGRKVTPDTAFYIASSTKSFTAAMAAVLHERGRLDLDAPVSKLSKLAFADGVDASGITLRSLLTHTHGIDNSGPVTFRLAYSGEHDADLLRRMARHHGPAEHGRSFRYGNVGYNLATLVIEDAIGKGWKELLQDTVLGPLGLASTTAYRSRITDDRLAWPYREDPDGFSRLRYTKADQNMHSAGGLVTTARDLGRWLIANVNDGVVDGKQALPKPAVAAAHRPQAKQDARYGPFGRTGYGLGWNTGTFDGETFVHHFGGFAGFHAHVSFMPEHDLGVAVVTNTSRLGSLLAIESARHVYDVLRDRKLSGDALRERLSGVRGQASRLRERIKADRERRASRSQKLNRPMSAYAGTYENDLLGRVTFKVVDDRLECEMGRLWSAVEVYDAERDALRIELTGGGTVALFRFPEEGEKAAALVTDGIEFRRVE